MRKSLRQNVLSVVRLTSLVALVSTTSVVSAQTFPDKPIPLISPSPPGGGTDTTSRLVANKVTELTKWLGLAKRTTLRRGSRSLMA